ncbi:MAG: cytochrome b N-terminal domain-containing protein, partial [Candidatus Kapabacteria bacterium]|nr:cytochrome b N-terminal domain-containing protein [Candidatus Kapabacteria bacterium]
MAPVQDFLHSVRSTFSLQWKHLLRPQSGLHIPVIISLQFLLSSLLICIVSGILLSLNFIPDTNPPRDDAGRLLVACSVENDVILYQNGQAQILYKRGEIAYLTYNEATGSIDYPTKDTAAFSPLARRTVIASRAWLSIRDIESSISAGAIIRSLHIWSVDLIMVSLFLTVVLWIHFQTYNSPYMLVWYALLLLLSLIVFSAWSGSILPWTLRSDSALRIVPSLLREYMPFGSALQSFLYNGQEINSASYNRIYSLHSVFSPLFIILLIVLLRRWSGRMP